MSGKVSHSLQYLRKWPEFVNGLWHLYRLNGPTVTVFGGYHVVPDSIFYRQAYELGAKIARANYSVVTGGGLGVMEAVLCGAMSTGKKDCCLGITVTGIDEPFKPRCARRLIYISNFPVRKWLMMYYSQAYIIFPGGIGTFDELGDIMNLIKMKQIKRAPVVLVGTEFWASFITWVDVAFAHGYIDQEFKELFVITDDMDEVMRSIFLPTQHTK